MTTIARVLALTALWIALWSDLTIANTLSGFVVASVVVATFPRRRSGHVVLRPVAATRLAVFFAVQLVRSTLVVARTVLFPGRRVHTGVVAVPLIGCSDAVVTLIADAISLTPGTLTIDVTERPRSLVVHALDLRDVDQVVRDVRRLEVLAVRAFGDDAAIAGLDVDDMAATRSDG